MADYSSALPTRTENNGDIVAKLCDGTLPSQTLAIDASGKIVTKLNDAAGNAITSQASGAQRALDTSLLVNGTPVDPRQVRALTSTDVVTATQGTAASITGAWPVKNTDGVNSQGYTAAGEAKVSVTTSVPLKAQLQDNAGTAIVLGQKTSAASVPVVLASDQSTVNTAIQVGGVAIDPRQVRTLTTLDVVTANVKDSSGNAISTTNPLPVVISQSLPGTNVNKYNTTASLAIGATTNHVYTVSANKTFNGKKFWASASGKIRADVQLSTDGTTFVTSWTSFNSTANPNISIDLGQVNITDAGTGAKVQIVITNKDLQPFDVYSTISGTET